MIRRKDNYVVLRSADDPDALGSSIADTFKLSWGDGMFYMQDYTLPHHLVWAATPKSQRLSYTFAYTMLGRAIHNKKDLLRVSLPSPVKSFPFWKLSPDQLIAVRQRLYQDLSYEAAQICMEIFLEVAEQALRDKEINADSFNYFSAICAEIPANRRNLAEEISKTVEVSIAECMLWKQGFISRRDICVLIFSYLFRLKSDEASKLLIKHVSRTFDNKYKITIPEKEGVIRTVYMADNLQYFLEWWLRSNEGTSLFCTQKQFPICDTLGKDVWARILTRRLSIICKKPLTEADFKANYVYKVQQAFDQGLIHIQARKLLLSQLVRRPRNIDLQEVQAFYNWLASDLGVWQIPYRKK